MAVSRPRYLDRAPTAIPQFSNGQSFLGVYIKSKRADYENAIQLAKEELGAAYQHEQFKMDYLLKLEKHAAAERAAYKKGAGGGSLTKGTIQWNTAFRADRRANAETAARAGKWTSLSDTHNEAWNKTARTKIREALSGLGDGSGGRQTPSQMLSIIRDRLLGDAVFMDQIREGWPTGEIPKPEIVKQLLAQKLTGVLEQDGGGLDYDPVAVAETFGEIVGLTSKGERLESEIANATNQAVLERDRLIYSAHEDTASGVRASLWEDNGYDVIGRVEQLKAGVAKSDIGQIPEVRAVVAPPTGAVRDTPSDVAAEWAATISDTYNLEPAFASKIVEVAGNVGASPGDLANLIDFETAHTFSPAQKNLEGSSGTGLIQFMASTAAKLGTTTAELAQMSQVEQMAYVEKYLQGHVGAVDLSTPEGLSAAVFFPRSKGDRNFNIYQDYIDRGKPEKAELFKKQNPGIETLGEYHDKLLKGAKIVQPPSVAAAQQAAVQQSATPAPTQDVDALLRARVNFPDPVTADAVKKRAGEIFNTEDTMLGKIQQRRSDRLGRKALRHMNNLPRGQRILWEAAKEAQSLLDSDRGVADEHNYGVELAGQMKGGYLDMDGLLKMSQELAGTLGDSPKSVREERSKILTAVMLHSLKDYRGHLAEPAAQPQIEEPLTPEEDEPTIEDLVDQPYIRPPDPNTSAGSVSVSFVEPEDL